MRLKNLNLVEKYIEKVVLGLAVLFALVVLWVFVLGTPHAVEIKALNKVLTPDTIVPAILKEANDLNQRISSNKSPFGDAVLEVPPYTDEFRDRLTRPLVPVDQFTSLFSEPGLLLKLGVSHKRRQYAVATPPAPSALMWHTGFGVLEEPDDTAMVSQFEKLIGTHKPRDFRWVSVSAEFDLKHWQDLLSKKPASRKLRRIPEPWWRPRLIVTDVMLQKQVQDPVTGKWGKVQTLDPLPGNDQFEYMRGRWFSFRTQRKNWAPPEAEAALTLAQIERNRLPRPLFPALAEGLWLPPDAFSDQLPLRVRDKVRQLADRIAKVQKQIKQLKQNMSEPGGKKPVASLGDEAEESPVVDLPTLETKRQKYLEKLYEILGIIEPSESSEDVKNRNVFGGRGEVRNIQDTQKHEYSALPDKIRVWQHDITVKDGQSVRYRILVSVLNPLFFRSQVPKEQQEIYFEKLSLVSLPSEWTAPVQILSEHHFFLSRANQSRKSVTVEVFCIFNGKWQKREFELQAGSPIGSVVQFEHGEGTANVNMNVGGVVVDIDFEAPSSEHAKSKTTRMIYFDGKTNSLKQRTLEVDQASPQHKKLLKNVSSSGG